MAAKSGLYDPFVEATKKGDWSAMKEFLRSHPEATTKPVAGSETALHYLFERGHIEIGGLLANEMRPEDLEITNNENCTAFAILCSYNHPGILEVIKRMVAKNPRLPNIGIYSDIPIVRASKLSNNNDTIKFLYGLTHEDVLGSSAGGCLLINCINIGLFDLATEIIVKFPRTLRIIGSQEHHEWTSPAHALAKYFSTLKYRNMRDESRWFKLNHWRSRIRKCLNQFRILGEYDQLSVAESSDIFEKLEYERAYEFLRFLCVHVSSLDETSLERYVYLAMVEAARNGIDEFVCEMLMANPKLIEANDFHDSKNSFVAIAIENRQEKVYCVVYNFIRQKDSLLKCENDEQNNILHLVGKLPPMAAIDRTPGPAMAMQREILWFEEIWNIASPQYRDALNIENLTPRELFAREHKDLIHEGERAMKETANSAAFVGALILTITFGAAFTVPGDKPILLRKIFIVCDALSLYSAIASILAIIGILTSSFAENDFIFKSPRRLMIGLWTLWFSLLTMMVGFCAVLALTLDGLFRYILPITLLVLIPFILVMSPIFPLCLDIYKATYGTNLFDKKSSLGDRIKKNMATQRGVKAKKMHSKVEEKVKSSNPSTGNNELV